MWNLWLPWLLLSAVWMAAASGEDGLRPDFYGSACPNVEAIVRDAVRRKLNQTVVTVPATLRLFFHDCFVQGCDASVMIASARDDAEKDAPDNLSLAGDGFDTVIKAKQAVEAQCPGVVSCADILAIAARDVVVLSGGPKFTVELGRRDGLVSQAALVADHLPGSDFNLDRLVSLFRLNNLTASDMIALSGAHTVGFSHCHRFSSRLYAFNSTTAVDPSLNATYAKALMRACPRNVDPTIAVNMDLYTPVTFDNVYYRNLINGEGLFTSDEVLFTDIRSRPTVEQFAADQAAFFGAFSSAMLRLGRLGVKTGSQGEIRRDCTAFNN
ncbi:peroxidase 51-like [Zingiber officinale]|uniref:peroxidase 51-like n=1 Tax=Zingiber officinale TaxID=94328 RepID=UPI001C4B6E61|nr:peroxidase 51-like [Zingiber officinale]